MNHSKVLLLQRKQFSYNFYRLPFTLSSHHIHARSHCWTNGELDRRRWCDWGSSLKNVTVLFLSSMLFYYPEPMNECAKLGISIHYAHFKFHNNRVFKTLYWLRGNFFKIDSSYCSMLILYWWRWRNWITATLNCVEGLFLYWLFSCSKW